VDWSAYPDLVRESEAVYAAYEGGDFVDVGAYHGWYSWLLASRARPGDTFVSIEPDPRAAAPLLLQLSELSRHFPAIVTARIPRALGSGQDRVILFPGGPTGHPQVISDGESGVNSTMRMDEVVRLLRLAPTFVKIDVEGAEWFVLQGMDWTLRTYHPRLMLELHPLWQPEPGTLERIVELLESHGYTPREICTTPVAIRQIWEVPPSTPPEQV
jgi:FkbM family methyltransferase